MNPETNPAGTSPATNDPTPQSPPADQPRLPSVMVRPDAEPWTHPVNGPALLDELERLVQRFVIVPGRARQALALWILHTYAFQLGEVSAYLGIESPEKRCGKTTLLILLSELVHRPAVASNISSPAFFRLIEETRPTLFIDEADNLLRGNDELRGILNSGYTRGSAFVVRVARPGLSLPLSPAQPSTNHPQPSGSMLARFSSWCPKAMAAIGNLPETLADRCIIIHMQRKTPAEHCERLRNLDPFNLRRQCARFVLDRAERIASARPSIPPELNDRAADIWEPLLALADLAGGAWPVKARQAAIELSASAQQISPIASLLIDIMLLFRGEDGARIFSRDLVGNLNHMEDRPWMDSDQRHKLTEKLLANQLRPYGIQPASLRIGKIVAKGYLRADFSEAFRRYIPRAEVEAMIAQNAEAESLPPEPPPPVDPPMQSNAKK